jgi:hypothetical protein
MAGAKVVRMLKPDYGRKIFEMARAMTQNNPAGDREWDGGWMGRGGGKIGSMGVSVRGEEMMVGEEGRLTEDVIWGNDGRMNAQEKIVRNNFVGPEDTREDDEELEGVEARLGPGDGLFIPKGWWHSIKGVGEGVNASVSVFEMISLLCSMSSHSPGQLVVSMKGYLQCHLVSRRRCQVQ